MSEAKPEKERRFIRILIMIVTNVSLNTRKNVDSTGTIRLITFSTPYYLYSSPIVYTNFYILYHYLLTLPLIIHRQWSKLLLFSFNNNKLDFKMILVLLTAHAVCKWMILNLIKIQLLIGHILTKSVLGHSGLGQ